MSVRARAVVARIAIFAPLTLAMAGRVRVGTIRPMGSEAQAERTVESSGKLPDSQYVMDQSEALLRLVYPDLGPASLRASYYGHSTPRRPSLGAWVVECHGTDGIYRGCFCWKIEGNKVDLLELSRTRRPESNLPAMTEEEVRAWAIRWLCRLGCVQEGEPVKLQTISRTWPTTFEWSSASHAGGIGVDERTGELDYLTSLRRGARPYVSAEDRAKAY